MAVTAPEELLGLV